MFRSLSAALSALVLFTGCLTIEENYTFRKNGSGTMEYVVDMSQLGEMIKGLGEMGEEGDGTLDNAGGMDMSGEVATLKGLPGISKVKLNSKDEWVQRISFAFKDIDALNAALNTLMPDSTGIQHRFFYWEGSTLVRTNNRHAYELGSSMMRDDNGDGMGDEDGLDLGAMVGSMKYHYSFKFAEDITSTTVADGVIRENKGLREVVIDTDFGVIGRDPNALDLRIDLGR